MCPHVVKVHVVMPLHGESYMLAVALGESNMFAIHRHGESIDPSRCTFTVPMLTNIRSHREPLRARFVHRVDSIQSRTFTSIVTWHLHRVTTLRQGTHAISTR